MKFDKVTSVDRGLSFILRDEAGTIWGSISSCYVSSNRGAFSRNYSNGFLIMSASVFNMNAKADTPQHLKMRTIAEATDASCKRRCEADRRFRDWIKTENLREKLITEAKCLREQLDEKGQMAAGNESIGSTRNR